MPNLRKVNFQGRQVDAESIEFEADRELWSTYLLHDGTTLKVKAVVTDVSRLHGEYNGNGDPVYMVQASQIIHIAAPENLRKPR